MGFAWTVSLPLLLIARPSAWIRLEEGLDAGEFDSPIPSATGDSKITVIRIDPDRYSFRLLCAGEMNHDNLTIREWCEKYDLIGAVNAGMFQDDHRSNVGYMRNGPYINNGRLKSEYRSAAAFDPVGSTGSPFSIFDLDECGMDKILAHYRTVVQNLRLIKRPAKNVWPRQDKSWSEAALGQDVRGRVLLLFSRSPYSMRDFNEILMRLPIEIQCAQHLEGGPAASLYFLYKDTRIEKVGSFETTYYESDNNRRFLSIPNVIGFYEKK
jgi:hypothetical protein